MWKGSVLCVGFLCLKVIISQPVPNEQTREPRQLDFGECCPCNDLNKNGRNVLTSTGDDRSYDDDCPCRSTMDSEPASSIFRPALRTVEPFVRPSEKGEPKPLLKPEVNLANSVLETLHEATNQEYQEALERDAARSALQDIEDRYTEDQPKNVINIIVKPKDHVDDMMIPEASHLQETRCIHPLGGINKLKRIRPSNRFGNVLLKPKLSNNGLIHKNYYDMSNSASNVQEQVLAPLGSSLLEDLKLKSDLLKMKLFPNLKYRLKNTQPVDNTLNPKNAMFDCDDSNNNMNIDFNVPNVYQDTDKNKENQAISIDEQEVEPTNIVENNVAAEDLNGKDCNERNQFADDSSTDSSNRILDVVASPSEISKVEKNDDRTDTYMNEDKKSYLKQENNDQVNDVPESIFEDTPTRILILDATTNNIHHNILSDDGKKEAKEEEPCYVTNSDDNASSNNNVLGTKQQTKDNIAKIIDTETTENVFISGVNNEITTSTESNILLRNNIETTNNIDALPNFRENILQTLENFKNANEEIHDKLRLNVQNALQLSGLKSSLIPDREANELDLLSSSKDISTEKNNNENGDVSMQDLQAMSNRILNLSEISSHESATITNSEMNNSDNSKDDEMIKLMDTSSSKNVLNTSDVPLESSKPVLKNVEEVKDFTLNKNKNQVIDSETMESSLNNNYCEIISPTKSETNLKTTNGENEMMSEASSPYVNRIPHTNYGYEMAPRLMSDMNMKEFLENLRSSVSDILNSDSGVTNAKNVYDDSTNNKHQQINFREPPFISSKPNNVDTSNAYKPHAKDSFYSNKNNIGLGSYKAKVPSPDSLKMKSLPLVKNTKSTHSQPTSNVLRKPSITSSKPVNNIINDRNPVSNLKLSDKIIPPTGSLKALSEKLRSQTEDALKKIHDAFDPSLKKSPLGSDNNVFSETFAKPVIFGTTSKNNDLSKKLQDFNKNLIDRLSHLSPRIPSQESGSWKTKHKPNIVKSQDILKSKQKLSTKTPIMRPTSSRREEMQEKSNYPILGQGLKLKPPPKKDIKLKKLKDSKVTVSFTTSARPELMKPVQTSKQVKKPSLVTLPPINISKKVPLKTAAQRKLELKSKLKNGEQQSLASESFVSRASLPDRYSNKSPISSMSEEELEKARQQDFNDKADLLKNTGLSKINNGDKLLSRLRDSLNLSALNSNNGNNLKSNSVSDVVPSASNNNENVATSMSTSIEKPLKENVSYRCKMVCFEDKTDSK